MLPKDKMLHISYSYIVFAGSILAYAIGSFLNMHPLSVTLLVGGWGAGLAVEAAQRSENLSSGKPIHEISFLDALCSAAVPTVAAALIELRRVYDLMW